MKARKQGLLMKVRQEGGSTVITVGKLIPGDWRLVELNELPSKDASKRVIEVTRIT